MEPISPSGPLDREKVSRHNLRQLLIAVMVVVPAFFFWSLFGLTALGIYGIMSAYTGAEEACTVARIPMYGVLTTTSGGYADMLDFGMMSSADSVVEQIEDAESDETILGTVIDIDSPGGTPVAGDEIAAALARTTKPTVVVVRDIGASAAYWAASGADWIIASPVSDVGSIGVTMSYTELAGANEEDGSRWIGISSGSYKDAGNPDRPLTDEEQQYFQDQVDTVYAYMLDRISQFRPTLSREEYAALADGRTYVGTEALKLKLIDAVGGLSDALAYVEEVTQREAGSAVLCPTEQGMFDSLL